MYAVLEKKNCSDTSLGFSPACFNVCKRQIRINDLEDDSSFYVKKNHNSIILRAVL